MLGVPEGERGASRHGYPRRRGDGRCCLVYLLGDGSGGRGDTHQGVEVDAGRDRCAECLDCGSGLGLAFGGRDQPEMSRRHGERVLTVDGTEDRDSGRLDGGSQQLRVVLGADLVEDHAGQADAGVECREPVQQRGDRRADPRRGDDQDDRSVEEPCDVGRRGEVAADR